jgi:plasmid maintenance system killer protein
VVAVSPATLSPDSHGGSNRRGQHTIRINDQWRICFLWKDGDAYAVEIVDYH